MSYDKSYELSVISTSFEKQVTSYKLKYATYKIAPAPADDSTVRYLDRGMIVWCRIVPYFDRIQLSWLIYTS
jgi:hypothetical protein